MGGKKGTSRPPLSTLTRLQQDGRRHVVARARVAPNCAAGRGRGRRHTDQEGATGKIAAIPSPIIQRTRAAAVVAVHAHGRGRLQLRVERRRVVGGDAPVDERVDRDASLRRWGGRAVQVIREHKEWNPQEGCPAEREREREQPPRTCSDEPMIQPMHAYCVVASTVATERSSGYHCVGPDGLQGQWRGTGGGGGGEREGAGTPYSSPSLPPLPPSAHTMEATWTSLHPSPLPLLTRWRPGGRTWTSRRPTCRRAWRPGSAGRRSRCQAKGGEGSIEGWDGQ